MCGGVRFEVLAPLDRAVYCHCTRCQRRTGTAAAASAFVAPGQLRVLEGEELIRRWQPPEGFAKAFCATCGSHLFTYRAGEDEPAGVRLGVIDGDPGVRPGLRQYVADAAAWEPIPDDGLPRHPGPRPTS